MFTLAELEDAERLVRTAMPATPTHSWPLLAHRTGVDVRVKHENHTPVGAFKIRGGIVYVDELRHSGRRIPGLITATRGNHGQSIARAATAAGLEAVVLVPYGNSVEKNSAMRALGATVIEHGQDFDEAREEAARLADERGLVMVPSFHSALAKGVATYALEMFRDAPDLDTVYVPIGMGSGICGLIRTRDLLGLSTKIVGVVAERAPAVALSFEAGRAISTNSAATFADGMACRVPNEESLAVILAGADRIVRVSETAIADAIRFYFEDTHNMAEGAGAAPLAALMSEGERMAGKRVGLVLSGGNMDRPIAAEVLAGGTPTV